MSTASSSPSVPIDPQLASVIVANILENWLDSSPRALTTAEVTDEPENLRTAAEQTGLHLRASVDPFAQVHHHQESTERQYALRQKALELGWNEPSIRTLDRDLGISGAHTT